MTKHFNHLLTRGMTVEVTDPKHPKSVHPATFLGQVCYCRQDHVLVMDTGKHAYDVFMDEILCLMSYKGGPPCYCLRAGEHGYDVVCVLPTGFVETLGTNLDIPTANHVLHLLSQPGRHQPLAA